MDVELDGLLEAADRVPVIVTNREANGGGTAAGARRVSTPLQCKVSGCASNLATAPKTHQRFRLCNQHIKAPIILVDGAASRFCQQCSRFHPLSEFHGTNRTCRLMLVKNRARQRIAAAGVRGGGSGCEESEDLEAQQPSFQEAQQQQKDSPGIRSRSLTCQPSTSSSLQFLGQSSTSSRSETFSTFMLETKSGGMASSSGTGFNGVFSAAAAAADAGGDCAGVVSSPASRHTNVAAPLASTLSMSAVTTKQPESPFAIASATLAPATAPASAVAATLLPAARPGIAAFPSPNPGNDGGGGDLEPSYDGGGNAAETLLLAPHFPYGGDGGDGFLGGFGGFQSLTSDINTVGGPFARASAPAELYHHHHHLQNQIQSPAGVPYNTAFSHSSSSLLLTQRAGQLSASPRHPLACGGGGQQPPATPPAPSSRLGSPLQRQQPQQPCWPNHHHPLSPQQEPQPPPPAHGHQHQQPPLAGQRPTTPAAAGNGFDVSGRCSLMGGTATAATAAGAAAPTAGRLIGPGGRFSRMSAPPLDASAAGGMVTRLASNAGVGSSSSGNLAGGSAGQLLLPLSPARSPLAATTSVAWRSLERVSSGSSKRRRSMIGGGAAAEAGTANVRHCSSPGGNTAAAAAAVAAPAEFGDDDALLLPSLPTCAIPLGETLTPAAAPAAPLQPPAGASIVGLASWQGHAAGVQSLVAFGKQQAQEVPTQKYLGSTHPHHQYLQHHHQQLHSYYRALSAGCLTDGEGGPGEGGISAPGDARGGAARTCSLGSSSVQNAAAAATTALGVQASASLADTTGAGAGATAAAVVGSSGPLTPRHAAALALGCLALEDGGGGKEEAAAAAVGGHGAGGSSNRDGASAAAADVAGVAAAVVAAVDGNDRDDDSGNLSLAALAAQWELENDGVADSCCDEDDSPWGIASLVGETTTALPAALQAVKGESAVTSSDMGGAAAAAVAAEPTAAAVAAAGGEACGGGGSGRGGRAVGDETEEQLRLLMCDLFGGAGGGGGAEEDNDEDGGGGGGGGGFGPLHLQPPTLPPRSLLQPPHPSTSPQPPSALLLPLHGHATPLHAATQPQPPWLSRHSAPAPQLQPPPLPAPDCMSQLPQSQLQPQRYHYQQQHYHHYTHQQHYVYNQHNHQQQHSQHQQQYFQQQQQQGQDQRYSIQLHHHHQHHHQQLPQQWQQQLQQGGSRAKKEHEEEKEEGAASNGAALPMVPVTPAAAAEAATAAMLETNPMDMPVAAAGLQQWPHRDCHVPCRGTLGNPEQEQQTAQQQQAAQQQQHTLVHENVVTLECPLALPPQFGRTSTVGGLADTDDSCLQYSDAHLQHHHDNHNLSLQHQQLQPLQQPTSNNYLASTRDNSCNSNNNPRCRDAQGSSGSGSIIERALREQQLLWSKLRTVQEQQAALEQQLTQQQNLTSSLLMQQQQQQQ